MPCDDARFEAYRLWGEGLTYDSLRAGRSFSSTHGVYCAEKCAVTSENTRVEIQAIDGDTAIVQFRVERTRAGAEPVIREGKARLKICSEVPPPLCG